MHTNYPTRQQPQPHALTPCSSPVTHNRLRGSLSPSPPSPSPFNPLSLYVCPRDLISPFVDSCNTGNLTSFDSDIFPISCPCPQVRGEQRRESEEGCRLRRKSYVWFLDTKITALWEQSPMAKDIGLENNHAPTSIETRTCSPDSEPRRKRQRQNQHLLAS